MDEGGERRSRHLGKLQVVWLCGPVAGKRGKAGSCGSISALRAGYQSELLTADDGSY